MINLQIFSSVADNVIDALSSMDLWNAIVKSISIILLGFFLTKAKIFSEQTPKVLTKIVLVLACPALAFTAFMSNITVEDFQAAMLAFVWGFVIYTLFIFVAKALFAKFDPEKRMILEILFVLGSTTFFGQPLIQAVFPDAFLESNMFNISYRVFLYSYAFIVISGVKFKETGFKETSKKVLLNPIVIATFVGFFLWSLQLALKNFDFLYLTVDGKTALFYRIDVTLPPVFQSMKTLGGLASPLVWLAIGGTLATISFKEAAKDKTAWFYSIMKIFVAPLLNLVLLLILNIFIDVNFTLIAATTIMWATPPATVAVSYCINYDKEALLASNCSFLGTFVAVAGIPIWIIVLTVIESMGIFN